MLQSKWYTPCIDNQTRPSKIIFVYKYFVSIPSKFGEDVLNVFLKCNLFCLLESYMLLFFSIL